MKRVVSLILVVLMMATLLCACGEETFTCDMCGSEVTEKPHTTELLGQKLKICGSCNDGLEALGDLGSLLG